MTDSTQKEQLAYDLEECVQYRRTVIAPIQAAQFDVAQVA